jgi:hypothetical protein
MCKLIFPRWTSHFMFIWYKWVNKIEVFRRFWSVCYLISSIYLIQLHHTCFLPFSSILLLSTILWKETIAMKISVHNHKLCKEQMELCNLLPFKPDMNKVHIRLFGRYIHGYDDQNEHYRLHDQSLYWTIFPCLIPKWLSGMPSSNIAWHMFRRETKYNPDLVWLLPADF